MQKTTITEALAELKTIDKRLAKKREFIGGYIARQDIVKDPLEKEGGSSKAIERERQSMTDLEERKVSIRSAISSENQKTSLTLGGKTRTIADWLVWRRDVAPDKQKFLQGIRGTIQGLRNEVVRKGGQIVESGKGNAQADVVVNVSEMMLAKEIEELEEILGSLDGQLSLKNATTFIEV